MRDGVNDILAPIHEYFKANPQNHNKLKNLVKRLNKFKIGKRKMPHGLSAILTLLTMIFIFGIFGIEAGDKFLKGMNIALHMVLEDIDIG